MRSLRLNLTPGSMVIVSLFVIAAMILSLITGIPAAATVPVAVLLVIMWRIELRGSTLTSWFQRRKFLDEVFEPVHLESRDTAGVLWDGKVATVYVELRPKEPFALTYVSTSDRVSRAPIDLRLLERMMVQNDIVLDSISVLSVGFRTALPRNVAANAVSQVVGQTPVPVGGTSYLVIRLNMETSHAAINSRAINGSIPYGVHRSVLNAATRIRILIENQGVAANVLSRNEISDLMDQFVNTLGSAGDTVSWDGMGDEGSARLVTFAPSPGSTRDDQIQWLHTSSFRSFEMTRLERSMTGTVTRSYAVSFVVSGDDRSLAGLRTFGARRVNGQHKQALSRILPLVAEQPFDVARFPLKGRAGSMLEHYPGGLGTFLGTSPLHGRVFMRILGGTGEHLYLIGPDALAQMVILRLAMDQVSVDVRMTGPGMGETWSEFVTQLRSRLITYNRVKNPDVVVVPEGHQHSFSGTDQTVIVVCPRNPSIPPKTSIVARGSDLTVTTERGQVTLPWTLSSQERSYLHTEQTSEVGV